MNLPKEFKNRMKALLGDEYEAFAEAFEKESGVKGLRFSMSRLPENKSPEDVLRSVFSTGEENGFENREKEYEKIPWSTAGYYWEEAALKPEDTTDLAGRRPEDDSERKTVRPGKSIYHEAGAFYMQEPSAMVVATLADVKPGEKVLDLCAAPGGKSTALGDALRGEGVLVSNEIHPSRAKILSENIERMGIGNAMVLNETPEKIAALFPEFFDCVVVDAPCSGEGMFRKEEAALSEWSPENVLMCSVRQRDILKEAVKCVSPGGRLIYSTCTFAPAEDEENIAWFLREYPDFHPAEIPDSIKEHVSFGRLENSMEPMAGCIRIWPHKQKGEGHFAAVLLRDGNVVSSGLDAENGSERIVSFGRNAENGKEKKYGKNRKSDKKDRGKNIALSREQRESFEIFAKEALTESGRAKFTEVNTYSPEDEKTAVLFGDNLYLEPFYFSGKGVKIERAGLQVGTFAKNRFEPSMALARALSPKDFKNVLSLSEDQKDLATAYLSGEQLSGISTDFKGWTLVTYDGYTLGFGKASNGVLKNHYPKGLRIIR